VNPSMGSQSALASALIRGSVLDAGWHHDRMFRDESREYGTIEG
jgi:hypothetical protein